MKSFINITSLVLLVSLFLFTPFDGFRRMVFLVPLFSVWFFSSILLNRKSIKELMPLLALLFGIMILFYFYGLVPGNEDKFRGFFTHVVWTYVWGIIGVFYARNIEVFKKGLPFVLVMMCVSCIYTTIGNMAIPGASRILAGSEGEGSSMYNLILSMHIGGYGFIYALVFAVMPCTLWVKQCQRRKLIPIIILILILVSIVVGSYFTSIILSVLALVLSLSNTRNVSTFIVVSALLAGIVYIFSDSILHGLIDIGAFIDSPMLQTRAQQLLDGTYQDAYEASGDYSRWDRMKNALYNISQNPIFGSMSSRSIGLRQSGHSELLGYFERFGVFGVLPVFYFYAIYKRIKRHVATKEMKLRLTIFFALFFIFITLNTFDMANSTGCMAFFIAPCTMIYLESKRCQIDQVSSFPMEK